MRVGGWIMQESGAPPAMLRTGGRFIEYLFGRNLLIGLASLMLLIISGYATWSGMNDFIIGASSASKGRGDSTRDVATVIAPCRTRCARTGSLLRSVIAAKPTVASRRSRVSCRGQRPLAGRSATAAAEPP